MSTATQSIREIVTSSHPQPESFIDSTSISACRPTVARRRVPGTATLRRSSPRKTCRCGGSGRRRQSIGSRKSFPGRLIPHIVRVHHHRVRQDLPRLAEMASMVSAKRSDRAPELKTMAELIEKLRAEMYAHILKEEQVLFPFISQMDQESIVAYPAAHACFRFGDASHFHDGTGARICRQHCGRADSPDKSL